MSARHSIWLLPALLAMAAMSIGCSQTFLPSARAAVALFHFQLDTQHYRRIYTEADPAFQALGPESAAAQLFESVHDRLGTVQSSSLVGYQVHLGIEGIRVVMRYSSVFSRGDAEEDFVWTLHGSEAQLTSYAINSQVMNSDPE